MAVEQDKGSGAGGADAERFQIVKALQVVLPPGGKDGLGAFGANPGDA